jgi:hypothetical protein
MAVGEEATWIGMQRFRMWLAGIESAKRVA